MEATPIRFSVIVPTHNRRDIVLDTVATIGAARRPWPCELIVVDDGSRDGTAEALRRWDSPLPTTVWTQRNDGAAAARNAGAALARGEFLLFLDDDMAIDPELIVEHDRALTAGADAVVGQIELDRRSPRTVLTRGVARWAAQRRSRLARSGGQLEVSDFVTGQLSVRAGWFAKMGGFDGALTANGTFGGEDTDFAHRLQGAGARLRFAAAAISHQRYVTSAGRNISQWAQAGRTDAALSRKHAGLGATLNAAHRGGSLGGRLARTLSAVPPGLTGAVRDRVVRRVDRGRTDLLTEYAFAKLRDAAYWTGVRAGGGLSHRLDQGVRILAYHAVDDVRDPLTAPYSVAPELFVAQVTALLGAGYTFIGADDLLEHLDGGPLGPRRVLLTFDDGYQSLLGNAAAVLREFDVPGVVCVVSDEIGGRNSWDVAAGAAPSALLTAAELGELRDAGWEVASHTRRHAHLTTLHGAELGADLAGSRAAVAGLGLGEPRLLAYPYGEHDARVRAAARRAGYAAALALTTAGPHPGRRSRYALPRIEVRNDTTPAQLLRLLDDPVRARARDVLRRELLGLATPALARLRLHRENHPARTSKGATTMTPTPTHTTVWCCEFDLAGDGELRSVSPARDETTMRVLVRLHGEPLGYLTLPRTDLRRVGPEIRLAAWREFGDALVAHLDAEGTPAPAVPDRAGWHAPAQPVGCPNHVTADDLVSVVVCTRNRSDSLAACLDRLAAVTYPAVEFLIVDNAPDDDSTELLVKHYTTADERFHYLREPRPGLSRARNAGLAAARGRYLAYTDDDVSVDSGWVDGLVRGFQRRPDVACVTGLVCTAAISNQSEAYCDARLAAWSTRCRPELFDLSLSIRDRHGVLYPFSPGSFGTGANFAFDRERLVRLGGFDEALGAGTPTRGGEDLDIFIRVLLAGGAIAYEPAAVVWHHHRADDQSLLRQMFGYGTGLTAYLTKLLLHRSTRGQLLRRVPAGLARIARIHRQTAGRMTGSVASPPGALRREFAGYLAGPILYTRTRRAVRASGSPVIGQ